MGPASLLLLTLLASVLDVAPENCGNENFGVDQQKHLSAPKGGSVRIPCSFHHSWELAEIPEVKIGWRWKHFHGDFIYKQTLNWTHVEFKSHLLLDWTQGQNQGALLIWNLRREDTTTCFCQVWLNTKRCRPKVFQSIQGTKLSVTPTAPGDCDIGNFGMNQPEHLAAPEGGPVRIPCTFHHSWVLAEIFEVKIGWRWKQFNGDFIYDPTLNWTHVEFKDRVCVDWTQDQTRSALLIQNLRRGDATTYFCQVWLNTKRCGKLVIFFIRGTELTVTPAQPEAGLDVTNSTQSSPLTLDTMVAVTVTVTLFKTTILGLMSYLVWKRSQGS